MMKFFRRIRQKYLQENRLSKYLPYAIGEIVLVVIGILIALQINNWNEERKNKIEEQRIFSDILEASQINKFLVERGSGHMKEVINAAKRLQKIINGSPEHIDKEQVEMDFHKLTWVFVSGSSNSLYDALTNSGDYGFISVNELRKFLTNLDLNQDHLFQFEEFQNRFVDEQLRPYLNKSIDRTAIQSTFQSGAKLETSKLPSVFTSSMVEVLKDMEFANLLTDLIFFTERILKVYDRISMDLENIDSVIFAAYPNIEYKKYIPY